VKKHLTFILPLALMAACSQAGTEAENHGHSHSKADASDHSHSNDKELTSSAHAQEAAPAGVIGTESLGGGFYMLTGPGGNIGVSTGDDGVFVIDDKFDRNADEIIKVIKTLSDEPIRYVVNTHYHGDHSGGNAKLKTTGATIVAHENVRSRMGIDFENKLFGQTVKAVPEAQWPTITFSENTTFYMNGQTVHVIYTPNAHTDGDSIVYFKEANILHMGDNFFNGMFPYIDVDSGGSMQGMIESHQTALDLINDETQVIPGHGPMATKKDLETAQNMLIEVQSRVKERVEEGDDLDTIIAAKLITDYTKFSNFINEDTIVKIAYISLTKSK